MKAKGAIEKVTARVVMAAAMSIGPAIAAVIEAAAKTPNQYTV